MAEVDIRIDALLLGGFVVAAFHHIGAVEVSVFVGLFLVTWIIPGIVLDAVHVVILGKTRVWESR